MVVKWMIGTRKERDPKNDKKKKFGYGADYVSEGKNKFTNR